MKTVPEIYNLFELGYPCSSGNISSHVALGRDCYLQSEILDILFLVIIQTFTFKWTSTLIKRQLPLRRLVFLGSGLLKKHRIASTSEYQDCFENSHVLALALIANFW